MGYFSYSSDQIQITISLSTFQTLVSSSNLACNIHAKGKSLSDSQKTSISQVPLDLGFRIIANVSEYLKVYLPAGNTKEYSIA